MATGRVIRIVERLIGLFFISWGFFRFPYSNNGGYFTVGLPAFDNCGYCFTAGFRFLILVVNL
jgi:hypothetical protein